MTPNLALIFGPYGLPLTPNIHSYIDQAGAGFPGPGEMWVGRRTFWSEASLRKLPGAREDGMAQDRREKLRCPVFPCVSAFQANL